MQNAAATVSLSSQQRAARVRFASAGVLAVRALAQSVRVRVQNGGPALIQGRFGADIQTRTHIRTYSNDAQKLATFSFWLSCLSSFGGGCCCFFQLAGFYRREVLPAKRSPRVQDITLPDEYGNCP